MSAAKENQLLQEHIKNNTFPSYKEMLIRMKQHPYYMEMYAEYGERNHDALKQIYESGMDINVAKKLGNEIYLRGGTWALQMNCTAFMYCGPFINSQYSHVRYNGGKTLEYAWDGIGDFKV
jgi:hypothetical protein